MHQIPSSNPKELQVLSGKFTETNTPDHGIFILSGDASSGDISALTPETGVSLPESSEVKAGSGFRLTIYHLNDFHGHLAHLTPEGETPVISRIAWQVRKHQQSVQDVPNRGVMFFSSGDDLMGSIFDELLSTSQQDFGVHASYHLYSAIGMDGVCLGNHDFDMGLKQLKTAIHNNANFPIFAANLRCPMLKDVCFPAAIYYHKGIRISVIGLVTAAELKISDSACFVTDPIPVAKNLVSLLRPHCDVLIILSHIGYSLANSAVPMKHAGDVELANSLPPGSVDLIIGAHSHDELNKEGLSPKNVINGIPIVQTGMSGRFLGQVDIKISHKDTAVYQAKLIPVETIPIDTEFEQDMVTPIVAQARSLFDQTLGVTSNDSMMIGDVVTARCDTGEIPIANFIVDALVSRLKLAEIPVDLAMIDASSLHQGLRSSGTITYGDWFKIMPYADTLRIFTLTGQELMDLLHDNAQRVDLPNEPRTERGFLFFSKDLRYNILIADNRANARASEVTFKGKPLESLLDKQFHLVSTDFVRQYSKAWEAYDPHYQLGKAPDLRRHPFQETGLYLRRELVRHIKQVGIVDEETGAVCDGRLHIIEHDPIIIKSLTAPQFMNYVSKQEHAMAGAVIAVSAAQALALGSACLSISVKKEFEASKFQNHLSDIQSRLIEVANQDAEAIARHVALRKIQDYKKSNPTKECQVELCDLPVTTARLSLDAVNVLQNFRQSILDRVRDDLEISIHLLAGSIQAAILLLESNLRIWPDSNLQSKYQPILDDLRLELKQITPVDHIRTSIKN